MNRSMRILGYAGLTPFLALPIFATLSDEVIDAQSHALFLHYSGIILGFMAGVIWPVLYQTERAARLSFVSVAPAVLGFLAIALLPGQALLLLAVLFFGLRLAELGFGIDRHYSADYRSLRWQLTLVVVACHLWLYWLI